MSDSKLQAAVEALRAELSRTPVPDPAEHERIVQLMHEAEHGSGSGREALVERIGATVRRLEVQHPTLTGCLGQIANALANIGI